MNIPAKKYDLIIFDCDGTLVDSHEMNHSIMAQVANDYGGLAYTMKSVEKEYLGVDYEKFFKIVADKEGIEIPSDAPQRCVDLALENIKDRMNAIENVAQTLEILASHYQLNVASNANRQIVWESLKAISVDHHFDEDKIRAGRAMATPKPAPDLFLAAANVMNVESARCLVIEDSVTGATAGVAAGMDVIGFTGVSHNKLESQKALKEVGVIAVYDDFIHIAKHLGH